MQTVRLAGKITVERIGEAFRTLREAFEADPDVRVDASAVEEADSAFLQVLAACERTAGARGGSFRLTGVSGALGRAAEAAGFSLEALMGDAKEDGDG